MTKLSKEQLENRRLFLFETYVAALRYYQYSRHISALMYPGDLVKQLWINGTKDDKDLFKQIAKHFVEVDHCIHKYGSGGGEHDWDEQSTYDRLPWVKFYQFCRGVLYGFPKVHILVDGATLPIIDEAFHTEFDDMWYSVRQYLINTEFTPDYIPERIVNIEMPNYTNNT